VLRYLNQIKGADPGSLQLAYYNPDFSRSESGVTVSNSSTSCSYPGLTQDRTETLSALSMAATESFKTGHDANTRDRENSFAGSIEKEKLEIEQREHETVASEAAPPAEEIEFKKAERKVVAKLDSVRIPMSTSPVLLVQLGRPQTCPLHAP
jgi:hypothetical protein